MIYHDRIEIRMTVGRVPPEFDEYGYEILDSVSEVVPGEVFALDTEVIVSGAIVASRYRMILGPQVDIPPGLLADNLRLGWGAYPVDPADPFGVTSGLRVDGAVERHMLRGRLHHYELITKAIT